MSSDVCFATIHRADLKNLKMLYAFSTLAHLAWKYNPELMNILVVYSCTVEILLYKPARVWVEGESGTFSGSKVSPVLENTQ